jgi:anthranilate 1,2-dioxygenase small subunit
VTVARTRPAGEALRVLVEDLQRRYVRNIDDGGMAAWPDFFTEDCRYLIVPKDAYEAGQRVGFYFCDGKPMLLDRVTCLREAAIYEPQQYRHVIGGTHIVDASNGAVVAETDFMVVRTTQDGDMGIFAAGRYRDEIVFENGEPKFRDKLVLTDSSRVDTLIAMPL